MENKNIPPMLWELKNEAVTLIQNYVMSNSANSDYKSSWEYLGMRLKSIGEKIESLANEFKQEE